MNFNVSVNRRFEKIIFLTVVFFVCQTASPVSWGQTLERVPSRTGDGDLQLVERIIDKILSEHISPPTRQQIYLNSAKSLLSAAHLPIKAELSEQFSNCSSREQLQELLDAIWKQVIAQPNANRDHLLCVAADGALRDGISSARLITAKEQNINLQLAENRYVGIGIRVEFDDQKRVKILEPFPGGTAFRGGVRKGDVVLEIDGQSQVGKSLGEVVDNLRGKQGSEVTVKFLNVDDPPEQVRTITMKREVIPLETVKLTKPTSDIASISFESITGSTSAELQKLAAALDADAGIRAAILDFRGVERVDIHHLAMLADQVLPDVDLATFATVKGLETIHLRPDCLLRDKQLFVLADSLVPGELFLFIHALQKHRGAEIVGYDLFTSGRLTKTVSLEDDLGAIDGFDYAAITGCPELELDIGLDGREKRLLTADVSFKIRANHRATGSGESGMQNVLEIVEKSLFSKTSR